MCPCNWVQPTKFISIKSFIFSAFYWIWSFLILRNDKSFGLFNRQVRYLNAITIEINFFRVSSSFSFSSFGNLGDWRLVCSLAMNFVDLLHADTRVFVKLGDIELVLVFIAEKHVELFCLGLHGVLRLAHIIIDLLCSVIFLNNHVFWLENNFLLTWRCFNSVFLWWVFHLLICRIIIFVFRMLLTCCMRNSWWMIVFLIANIEVLSIFFLMSGHNHLSFTRF